MSTSRLLVGSISISMLFGLGCSDRPDGFRVSGAVTYEGKKLDRGLVNFFAEGQRPRGGPIRADGTYECFLPAGSYRVIVSVGPELPPGYREGDPIPPQKLSVPEKFANPRTSGMVIDVSEPQTYDIRLD